MASGGSTVRPGSKTLEVVLKTDELYGHDGLWLGPRGRDYGMMLPNPKPYQHANLYPDPNSTYWFSFHGDGSRSGAAVRRAIRG